MTYPPQQPQDPWSGQQPGDPYQQQSGYPDQPSGYPDQPAGYPDAPGQGYGQGYGQPPPDPTHQYPYGQPGEGDPYAPMNVQPMSSQPMSGQPMSGQPVTGQPWPGVAVPQQAAGSSGPPVWVFIVGAVALVALIGAGVFLAFELAGDDDPKDETATEEQSDEPSDDSSSEDTTDGEGYAVTDSATGLSYTELADPWEPAGDKEVAAFLSAQGQFLPTASDTWGAFVSVGEVDADLIGYDGTDSLKDSVKELAKEIEAGHYTDGEGKPLEGFERDVDPEYGDIDVDGNAGMGMGYHVTWDDDAVEDTGEYIVIGIVDIGEDGRAAGFYVGMPDGTPEDEVDAVEAAMDGAYFA
ncbi:MAG: hypothetical protein ACRDXX_01985 [Stackebrandtia sp.]